METTKQETNTDKKGFVSRILRFFHEHPFAAWNILTIIFFFISWQLSFVFFFASLIFWNKRKQELKLQQKISEAEDYIDQVKEKRALPIIKSSIFLDKGERAFLEEQTKLNETRAVRKYSGGMGGVGFRVGKRIYVGGGRRGGISESHQEWRTIDRGDLVITNQRLIFRGSKENRTVLIKKIISVDVYRDAIKIDVESRSKAMIFSVKNSYIWGAVINIIRQVDDPLNLGDMNLEAYSDSIHLIIQ